ncbi:uncharacterized protein DSM5745_07592 [Aspergillus mulundensis]|uniref:Uncharacterized protein n=1 Tax=Aspergillus mulundensis TaxID=1810919 RepID=A0A3D8REL1_9EURO|nr:hypothetical protein DSM5745_07592 [Aspergillus mulundensis]RDW72420.1 hypothetical protein DSM5745_07592 [Aspergillus mulundensis]
MPSSNSDPKDARRSSRQYLRALFRELEERGADRLDPTALKSTGITIKALDLSQPLSGAANQDQDLVPFFQPWKLDSLASYPLDLTEESTKEVYGSEQRAFTRRSIEDPTLASSLFTDILAGFIQYERIGLDRCIMRSSEWFECNIDDHFLRDEYRVTCSATDRDNPYKAISGPSNVRAAWHIRDDKTRTSREPHALFTMTHTVPPPPPPTEQILRTEILAILGVMLSRLRSWTLRDFSIIPVLLISCFNRYKARVLYGYMSDNGLVIACSCLHDFSTQQARDKNFNVFFSWMASEPIGNTKSLSFGPMIKENVPQTRPQRQPVVPVQRGITNTEFFQPPPKPEGAAPDLFQAPLEVEAKSEAPAPATVPKRTGSPHDSGYGSVKGSSSSSGTRGHKGDRSSGSGSGGEAQRGRGSGSGSGSGSWVADAEGPGGLGLETVGEDPREPAA